MNIMPKYLPALASPSRWSGSIGRRTVSAACVLADTLLIVTLSCLTGAIYHELFYADAGALIDFAEVGLAAAIIFVLPGMVHGDYQLSHYLSFKAHVRRASTLWNITLLCLLMLGFLIKTTSGYSRGAIILFYLTGLPAILLVRYALVRTVVLGSKIGLAHDPQHHAIKLCARRCIEALKRILIAVAGGRKQPCDVYASVDVDHGIPLPCQALAEPLHQRNRSGGAKPSRKRKVQRCDYGRRGRPASRLYL